MSSASATSSPSGPISAPSTSSMTTTGTTIPLTARPAAAAKIGATAAASSTSRKEVGSFMGVPDHDRRRGPGRVAARQRRGRARPSVPRGLARLAIRHAPAAAARRQEQHDRGQQQESERTPAAAPAEQRMEQVGEPERTQDATGHGARGGAAAAVVRRPRAVAGGPGDPVRTSEADPGERDGVSRPGQGGGAGRRRRSGTQKRRAEGGG